MFFHLSKLLWVVATPSNLLFGAILLGVLLRRRGLALTALALTLALAVLPAGPVLFHILENRFPTLPQAGLDPTGIVVLGGAIDDVLGKSRGQVSLDEAAERMTEAVALSRLYPKAKLVFSGGSNSLLESDSTEAGDALRLWTQLGVEPARITLEDRSRNTYENAVLTRDLVKPKAGETWLLVTSAWHMPRAAGLFRAADFKVTPYPVDYRTPKELSRVLRPQRAIGQGLNLLDSAAREWIGLAAYRAAGKTDAFFPGP